MKKDNCQLCFSIFKRINNSPGSPLQHQISTVVDKLLSPFDQTITQATPSDAVPRIIKIRQ